jgi:hypothetical protein
MSRSREGRDRRRPPGPGGHEKPLRARWRNASRFPRGENGNGRDFDIIPLFTGEYGHGYVLTFDILDANAPAPVVFYSSGHYVDAASTMRLYVRQSDLRGRFPAFAMNRPYLVRATVTLDVGYGGPSGYWSPAFIDRTFPVRERSFSMSKMVTL